MRVEPASEDNVRRAISLCHEAIEAGAQWIVLPESYCGIGSAQDRAEWAFHSQSPHANPLIAPFIDLARSSSTLFVLGGIPERSQDDLFNTAVVVGPSGVLATYRKRHLFDADPGAGPALRESASTNPGTFATLVSTPWAKLGLSICYDLRFPEHYRALMDHGAEVLLVPSAFTAATGAAHWEILLRARAIENQAYVVAPALDGPHGRGRSSYGHTMIVDPWGVIVAQASSGSSAVTARLEENVLEEVRRRLPALRHRQPACPKVEVTESNIDPTSVSETTQTSRIVAQPLMSDE